MPKQAIIIGAGPAGLTAAYELLTRTEIVPTVIEKSAFIGGISRTANYKGNRMDIGGHRFFSKSDRVMEWWFQHMPIEAGHDDELSITYQQQSRQVRGNGARPDPEKTDEVMLVRQRRSRIYFLRKFFDYPIKLTGDTLGKLGLKRSTKIGFSYIGTRLSPIRNEKNLEEFFINRFGRELYGTFFKSYTEKVWGVPCDEISAEWGAQRIKGLSITKAIGHFLRQTFASKKSIQQKETETSLIEQFLYPKLGPGQMWELVAEKVRSMGGTIVMNADVIKLETEGARVCGITIEDSEGYFQRFNGDYFFSTMPVKELIDKLDCPVPPNVREVSQGLQYRDFITVGLLMDKLRVKDRSGKPIDDNWIYVQEPDVLVGRLQIFNNWSPYLVGDKSKTWIGAEYFCYEGDELWRKVRRGHVAVLRGRVGEDRHPRCWVGPGWHRPPRSQNLSCLFRELRPFPRDPRMDRPLRQPLPGGPQRDAQVQQPGPLDVDGDDRGGQHHHRPQGQRECLGSEHRDGIPREQEIKSADFGHRRVSAPIKWLSMPSLRIRGSSVLLMCVLGCTLNLAAQSTDGTDSDHDGLSDQLEQSLLATFRPTFMISASDCASKPARFANDRVVPQVAAKDGTLYGQVSPRSRNIVELHYYTLWDRDCGRISHPLDAEHAAVLVSLAGPEPRALYWYAGAHEKTVCDISSGARARTVDAEFHGARLWSSSGKHALYLREAMCAAGCGADSCSNSVELSSDDPVVNIGEPGALNPHLPWVLSAAWPLRDKMKSDFPPEVMARLDTSGEQVATLRGSSTIRGAIQGSDNALGGADIGAEHTEAALYTANTHTSHSLQRAAEATQHSLQRAWKAVSGQK